MCIYRLGNRLCDEACRASACLCLTGASVGKGFFTSYLIGGVSIAVLAVGSTAPGLLEVAIGKFSALNPVREAVIA